MDILEFFYDVAPDQGEVAFVAIPELVDSELLIGLPFLTGQEDDFVGLTLPEVKILKDYLERFIERTEVRH